MRPLLYVLTAFALMSLAFWAYRENYTTQGAIREVAGLQDEIADLRGALALQKAEWAYLNRPERLRDLAQLNFDALGLLPLEPGQFGRIDQVVYPLPPEPEPEPEAEPEAGPVLSDPLDAVGIIEEGEAEPL